MYAFDEKKHQVRFICYTSFESTRLISIWKGKKMVKLLVRWWASWPMNICYLYWTDIIYKLYVFNLKTKRNQSISVKTVFLIINALHSWAIERKKKNQLNLRAIKSFAMQLQWIISSMPYVYMFTIINGAKVSLRDSSQHTRRVGSWFVLLNEDFNWTVRE